MATDDRQLDGQRALVTGGARRIGAAIVRRLHAAGATVGIHCLSSADAARELRDSLNERRPGSAEIFPADLADATAAAGLAADFHAYAGGIDILVNNASAFYPTPVGTITETAWDDLVGSNLKGPLFLTQAAAPALADGGGAVVNVVDIHAKRPLSGHAVYGLAKAGLTMLTLSLAKELAPAVRVNGVAPGAILWPESGLSAETRASILNQVPLGRSGEPGDVADCVIYLATAPYVTGQIIAVDGGRSLGW